MEAVEVIAAPSSSSDRDRDYNHPNSNNNNKDLSPISKGKRTKRQRPHSPTPFTFNAVTDHRPSPTFVVASSDDSTTTAEEETARCLILLSKSGDHIPVTHPPNRNFKQKRNLETTAAAKTNGGTCMYTCKTCNRSFSSFQALGGHRASHKKPKNEKKSTMLINDSEDFPSASSISSSRNKMSSNSLSLQLSNISTSTTTFSGAVAPPPRMHECSYCGAEFTSGQALGGHMRRHRGGAISPSSKPPPAAFDESKNPRNFLSLDLNLPAPEDENQRFGFSGSMQQKSPENRGNVQNETTVLLGLSTTTATSTWVDCHY